jgi:hypothetical protein
MAHSYGGVLGVIAFLAVLVRGMIGGAAFFPTLIGASLFMGTFAIVGFVLGAVAAQTVKESVQMRLNAELNALTEQNTEA